MPPKEKQNLRKNVVRPRASSIDWRLGFIQLWDCAPLVAAAEFGLFAQNGLRVRLQRMAGWASVRDALAFNEIDGSHAVGAMTIAMKLGLQSAPVDVFCPFILNLEGNAITLSIGLWEKGVRDAKTLKQLIKSTPSRQLVFAVVSQYSYQHALLRQWLEAGGIESGKEIRIAIVPPAQMVGCLRAGLIDGFCVAEPCNTMAVLEKIGWCPATSRTLAPRHAEKIFLVREPSSIGREAELLSLIKALHEAAALCEKKEARNDLIKIMSSSSYLDVPEKVLRASVEGELPLHPNATAGVGKWHIFHGNDANAPTMEKATMYLNQIRRTHDLALDPKQTPSLLRQLFREDIYRKAMTEPLALSPTLTN